MARGGAKKTKVASGPVASVKLPPGEKLCDLRKQSWKVGDPIGRGGFGEIYLAERADKCTKAVPPSAGHVVKIEPNSNGPLFTEISFYTRCAKEEAIEKFLADHKLKHLGMPQYVAQGRHTFSQQDYRFLVMQRFYGDIDSKFVDNDRVFPQQTVCRLAISVLNVLEYLHELQYVHADIKGSNLLLSKNEDEIFVVDFGLAAPYTISGQHRVYKRDPKRAHDGTIEFTSRDAHDGVAPSRRGDMEILGYVALQWLCSHLPWEDKLDNKSEVAQQKERFLSGNNIPALMRACFGSKPVPSEIQDYFKEIKGLGYDEKPNYDNLRRLFSQALRALKCPDSGKLQFGVAAAQGRKRRSSEVKPELDDKVDGAAAGSRKRKKKQRAKSPAVADTSPGLPVPASPSKARSPRRANGRRKAPLAKAATDPCAATVGPKSPAAARLVAATVARDAASAAPWPAARGKQAIRGRATAPPEPRAKKSKQTSTAASNKIPSPSDRRGPPLHL